jgi:hypothetical protein
MDITEDGIWSMGAMSSQEINRRGAERLSSTWPASTAAPALAPSGGAELFNQNKTQKVNASFQEKHDWCLPSPPTQGRFVATYTAF